MDKLISIGKQSRESVESVLITLCNPLLTSANRLKVNVDKTELLFASSGHCCAAMKGSYPVLQ